MTTAEMRLRALARPPRRLLRRARTFLLGGAVILLYHRVHDGDFDPWLLNVSLKNFDDHMAHLRQRYAVLSLAELCQGLAAGRVPRGAVAVTFDDGYADNLRNAKPILERHRVPATVFVTSGYVGARREFWWDELERVVLHAPSVPERLTVTLRGSSREWLTGVARTMSMADRLADRRWNVERSDDPTPLHRAFREIHAVLSVATSAEQDAALADLRQQTATSAEPRDENVAMSPDGVRELAAGGLVSVGAHTVTHPVLSALPPDDAAQEIRQSKQDLEQILGVAVTSFAYPFGYRGAYTDRNIAAARGAGITDAYSNFGGVVRSTADRYQLNRILVRDWAGSEFARRVHAAFGD
jgi:peptidoglycan/xylan/chitin deacetylase (PgdA/CDA1 family)